jgi:hypothetical protein
MKPEPVNEQRDRQDEQEGLPDLPRGNPATMRAVQRGQRDIEAGNFTAHAEVALEARAIIAAARETT